MSLFACLACACAQEAAPETPSPTVGQLRAQLRRGIEELNVDAVNSALVALEQRGAYVEPMLVQKLPYIYVNHGVKINPGGALSNVVKLLVGLSVLGAAQASKAAHYKTSIGCVIAGALVLGGVYAFGARISSFVSESLESDENLKRVVAIMAAFKKSGAIKGEADNRLIDTVIADAMALLAQIIGLKD